MEQSSDTVSRQFLTPNYPCPNCLLNVPPNCLSPAREGIFSPFRKNPSGKGKCAATERQKLSRGNFCLAALRWLSGSSGSQKFYIEVFAFKLSLLSRDNKANRFVWVVGRHLSRNPVRDNPSPHITQQLFPSSHKRCFPNGVFQSWVFRGWLVRIRKGRRHRNA